MAKRGKGAYRTAKSPYIQIDVQYAGARLRCSSGTTSQREAEAIIEDWKTAQRRRIAGVAEPKAKPDFTINEAAARYYEEIGAARKSAEEIDRDLAWLVENIGPDTRLSEIDENLILRLMAQRRGEGSRRNAEWAPVSETTLNREIVERLRAVLTRAAKVWKVEAPIINWKDVVSPEPEGGQFGKELTPHQEAELFAKLRPDLHAIMRFAVVTGVRMGALTKLEWRHVDFDNGTIRVEKKTRKPGVHWHTVPMTREARQILLGERGRHPRAVWTYVVHQRRGSRTPGDRLPLTWHVLRNQTDKAFKAAGLRGDEKFRRHDMRHTAARRVLRHSKNLSAVKSMLGHSDISMTVRYASATLEDVRSAMETGVETVSPENPQTKVG